MQHPVILHSDMNSFYASVEIMLDPTLRGKPVAVCGSTEERHGIVLAKSEAAKKSGVKTGMVNWQARQWCPSLIIVPPHYDQYLKYSALAREIYGRYTDRIEPFGMDECWLDVSGSVAGDGETIAHEIRNTIREELGLTVSVGASFTKIFAKLGSDMKKPDAVTAITEGNFREKVWPLPASDLLYVGPATTRKLADRRIYTIGDIANRESEYLKRLLGVNGEYLWLFANGLDRSRVAHKDFVPPIKSVGHGTTCIADLLNDEDVWKVMLALCQDVSHRLRVYELLACGVQIFVRDCNLWVKQYQTTLPAATRGALELARAAFSLFHACYAWSNPVRSVTVRAIRIIPQSKPQQTLLFDDPQQREKHEKLEGAVDDIRRRFGKNAILPATLMQNLKYASTGAESVRMPGLMYR